MNGLRPYVWLMPLLLLAAVGCDNSVEPFAATTRHFAIYGFLDAASDTQYVRIEPTRPLPDAASAPEFGIARVSTTDEMTQEMMVWRDSTILLEDGQEGLLYWAPFQAVEGHRYLIEVVREDGASSRASNVVPDLTTKEIRRPSRTFRGTFEQSLILPEVFRRPESITMNYLVTLDADEDPVLITLDYNVFGVRIADGWKIDVRLTRDRERIQSRLGVPSTAILRLYDVSVTLRLLSEDWPAIGSDERGSNVEEGFGFFGAAATHHFGWRIDSLVVAELGYVDRQGEQSAEN